MLASVLPSLDARAAAGKTIVCHLGNGVSACALQAGNCMTSTMGFTGVEGLPMGTRSGGPDPGVLLWLMDQRGMGARHRAAHLQGLRAVRRLRAVQRHPHPARDHTR
jgi:acetate kinase